MRHKLREVVYWILAAGALAGSISAGVEVKFYGSQVQAPFQGLSVALGVVASTLAVLADRAGRDRERRRQGVDRQRSGP